MEEKSGWSPEPVEEIDVVTREPLGDLLARLVADGRAYAQTEKVRLRLGAAFIARNIAIALILVVVALTLLIGALVTLLIGLVLALAPLVGTFAATAIVIAASLVIIALLAWLARARVTAAIGVFASKEPNDDA